MSSASAAIAARMRHMSSCALSARRFDAGVCFRPVVRIAPWSRRQAAPRCRLPQVATCLFLPRTPGHTPGVPAGAMPTARSRIYIALPASSPCARGRPILQRGQHPGRKLVGSCQWRSAARITWHSGWAQGRPSQCGNTHRHRHRHRPPRCTSGRRHPRSARKRMRVHEESRRPLGILVQRAHARVCERHGVGDFDAIRGAGVPAEGPPQRVLDARWSTS